ncbi:NAD(P)-binding oxidoreductase [Glaciihabitans sp. dw_435]|uniref:NAD(P)-binding oxidoreductase n=1 Tax=Glaciihabitans sp. dw_435 TaxID=2720081 RepID=UPI001BD41439|nr:NAD(P)-binding oxidoreductase [Glaciihabitans sp. dw_435]
MRIVIAGGHGQIALLLEKQLADAGHEAIGIIRNPEHVADVVATGATTLLLDLEQTDASELSQHIEGADAVVFAAGGGAGGTAERKLTVDRDAAIMLADAAQLAGIRRYVVISAMATDSFDPESSDVFQVYLRAKSEADAEIRTRDLDWTIIRPGGLTDEPATGLIKVATETGRGTIPRADVAAVVVAVLGATAAESSPALAVREQFEVISGSTAIADALK